MKTIRIVVLLAVIVAIMIPSVVLAQDEEQRPVPNKYYCSWDVDQQGDGSYDRPWLCRTQEQINRAIDKVCQKGGGILYQIEMDGYWRYVIRWFDHECDVVKRTYHRGYPPDTGIALPPTLAFSGALVLGLSLFAVGLVVYRKQSAT